MEYTKEGIEKELTDCISTINIPINRKPLTEHNLKWMLRNMGIKNSNHPKFERAMSCIKYLLHMVKPK